MKQILLRQSGFQRWSDLVTFVCLFASFVLYLHVQVLSTSLSQFEPAPYGGRHGLAVDPQLNLTGLATFPLVFFNKIPRCGSASIGNILNGLGPRHGFKVFDEKAVGEQVHFFTTDKQRESTMKDVEALPVPAVVIHEVNFLNFSRLGHRRPVYVSLVRDPIEHAFASFYILRAPYVVAESAERLGLNSMPKGAFFRKSFEECVRHPLDKECKFIPGSQKPGSSILQRFCEHPNRCSAFGSREALQVAKHTVEAEYAVVGVLEDWEVTLAVLENYVPAFFAGARQYFNDEIRHNITLRNTNFYKPKLTENIRRLLAANFTVETEFYEFCRQRLNRQYVALNA